MYFDFALEHSKAVSQAPWIYNPIFKLKLFLDNSDLLAVTVTSTHKSGNGQQKQRRFLVVDVYQIILVEPDSTKLGKFEFCRLFQG